MNAILARLLQPSTIRGLIMLTSGVTAVLKILLEKDPLGAAIALGSGAIGSGTIGVVTNDNKPVIPPTTETTFAKPGSGSLPK